MSRLRAVPAPRPGSDTAALGRAWNGLSVAVMDPPQPPGPGTEARAERLMRDRKARVGAVADLWQVELWFAKGGVTITRASLEEALDYADTFYEDPHLE